MCQSCVRIPSGVLCSFSNGVHRISVNGRIHLFEWMSYDGPVMCRKDGEFAAKQPGPKHPWWDAVQWWHKQGGRERDGLCVWNREHSEEREILAQEGRHIVLGSRIIVGERCELEPGF
jgi:hypothetical protein